jgi:hypothetical protein
MENLDTQAPGQSGMENLDTQAPGQSGMENPETLENWATTHSTKTFKTKRKTQHRKLQI